ncbi:hypothetical protein [uncultured Aliiroseovarius sp.]|uniref:hypothetical protein n=1 Tax=uncultured Aliiroseovarius sp. TaxID=1658783 RepID=UPI00259792F6|nr:hypothetical protein [uncultured Aliiroseovarius sp.]
METRAIEIDFEIHQCIEANRQGFDEAPNTVLRRLLGLTRSPEHPEAAQKSWRKGKVELPHGTELMADYNGQSCSAKIVSGSWINEDGSVHSSPSSAMSFAKTKDGKSTSLNGKIYWKAKVPGSTRWVLYKALERSAN